MFAACLSAISIGTTTIGQRPRSQIDMTVFLCFLPMAFFFVAQSTHRCVSRLERRIADLEKRAGDGDA